MHPFPRSATAALALAGLVVAADPALALGFGTPVSQAVLGETLLMTVPLRLESAEEVSAECLSAEVFFGEDRVQPAAVSVTPSAASLAGPATMALRVRTTTLINEPVVTVLLSAGCQARITRKIVALADPPVQSAQASQAASVVRADQVRTAVALAAAVATPLPDVPAPGATPAVRPQRPQLSQRPPVAARRAGVTQAPTRSGRLQLDPVDADAAIQPGLRWSGQLSVSGSGEASDGPDGPEVRARRDAAAALWRALNATPEQLLRDQQRIGELEQRLARLQVSGDQASRQVGALQARVRDIEQQRSAPAAGWAWRDMAWALAALGVGLLAHAWGARRARHRAFNWWGESSSSMPLQVEDTRGQDTGSSDPSGPRGDLDIATAPSSRELTEPAGQPAVAPLRVPGAAIALVASTEPPAFTTEPVRAVSVEELIDLEQQAEFFEVLGQDEAAIQLLEGHIEGGSGVIPWPFLKLLEIQQRLGRRADYERVQAAFNERFNAHAPTWESDLEQGRELADYPGVIERLQALWPAPVRAMAVLERSLTRVDAQADTFDLPAYRELLLLYAVARELADRDEVSELGALDGPDAAAHTHVTPLTAAGGSDALRVDLDLDALQGSEPVVPAALRNLP